MKEKYSRRNILKVAAAGTIGAAVGYGGYEVIKDSSEWIETEHGHFYPMYENHLSGINPESIPKETDVFFREGNVDRLDASVIEKLKEDDILLMFESIHENGWRDLGEVGVAAGTIFAEGFGGGHMLNKALKKDNKPLTNRRKVLKAGAGLAGLWSTSLAVIPLLAMPSTLQDDPQIARIAAVPTQITSLLHPENITGMLRSLMWSRKMLLYAEEYKDNEGKKPHIVFNVGIGHGDTEFFLKQGPDFCLDAIKRYPDFVHEFRKKLDAGQYGLFYPQYQVMNIATGSVTIHTDVELSNALSK